MVCELTLGRKKCAEFEAVIAQVHAESARLQSLLTAIDKDTEAFNLVSAVFIIPKETEKIRLPSRLYASPQRKLQRVTLWHDGRLSWLPCKQLKGCQQSNTNAASDLG